MNRLLIIGGGIAGLSAGIFAEKNGFESMILEKNRVLGGECTGWDRQGFHIDGCIHWLVGTKKGTPMNDLWGAVGALDEVEIYHPESFLTFEHENGTVHMYRDLSRLKESWLALSPCDERAIRDFCKDIERLHAYEIPVGKPTDLMEPVERIRYLASMKEAGLVLRKYGLISLKEFAAKFNHPALREALASFLPNGYSASSIFFALAAFTKGQASVPFGGSRQFSQRMAKRYLALGGTIETLCEAIELRIDHKKVCAVICNNGKAFETDYVIAACDAHVLFERLLGNRYDDRQFLKRYRDPVNYPLASEIRVALGYEGRMDDMPRTVRFPVNPFRIHKDLINLLTMTHYSHEPDFAPNGHTLITVSINQFHDDYDAWHALYKEPIAYRQEKARIGEAVIQAISTRFPQLKGKLTLLDVATPKTFERYCNAYRGAFMSFLPTVGGKMMAHTGRIKGLNNLFLSGQWLQPPRGLPVALITGRDTIMRICNIKNQPFTG